MATGPNARAGDLGARMREDFDLAIVALAKPSSDLLAAAGFSCPESRVAIMLYEAAGEHLSEVMARKPAEALHGSERPEVDG